MPKIEKNLLGSGFNDGTPFVTFNKGRKYVPGGSSSDRRLSQQVTRQTCQNGVIQNQSLQAKPLQCFSEGSCCKLATCENNLPDLHLANYCYVFIQEDKVVM